ncbi:hypothetical protein PDIDSM_409 [Penicillium digitatum]|nr:hypothetical protein PDIDSM_409 [Penicillium digitatum]
MAWNDGISDTSVNMAFTTTTIMLESPLTFRIPELLPGPLVVIALATHPAATDYDLSNVELVGRCCAVEGGMGDD